jgi:hypothetical protein
MSSPTQPQMDLLYMQAYGHVLGIFTRNAEPTQMETSVDGFVGSDGYHLRGLALNPSTPDDATQQMEFVVPQDMIAAMHTPQTPTGQPPSPQSTYVSPLPPGTPTPQSFSSGSTISVSTAANPPTITPYGQSIPSGTQVLVLVFGPTGSPITVRWTILAGASIASTITIPVPASPTAGLYYLVAFVPSFPIAVGTYTVP